MAEWYEEPCPSIPGLWRDGPLFAAGLVGPKMVSRNNNLNGGRGGSGRGGRGGRGRNETATQRDRRLEKAREKYKEKRANETEDARNLRLAKRRKQNEALPEEVRTQQRALNTLAQSQARDNETPDQRAIRLTQVREHMSQLRDNETPDQRVVRLTQVREHMSQLRENETPDQRVVRLTQVREHMSQLRENETPDQRVVRLTQVREHMSQLRENETLDQRVVRLTQVRESMSQFRGGQTPEERGVSLRQNREAHRARRAQYSASIDAFKTAINTFCDQACDVCNKTCYPNQITRCTPSNAALSYLPDELVDKGVLDVCFRCKTHLTSNKNECPSKAYWNSLDPGVIPDEIKDLTLFEKRLLSRIKVFVRIVRLRGRFGQLGFKGQAILFGQDLHEVTEALPNMLPISTQESGMVVVTEHLENINCTREFTVSRDRIFKALRWLIENNPLYQDVTVDNNVRIEQSDIIRVQEPQREPQELRGQYKLCNSVSRILQASHHQGNLTIYPDTAGKQCCAMAFANIVRASIVPPRQWSKMMLDENMFSGDDIYNQVITLCNRLPDAQPVDQSGYLSVNHLAVIRENFEMFEKTFKFECASDSPWYGNLRDALNDNRPLTEAKEGGMLSLKRSLERLFATHSAGIFIAIGKC
ncbi:hypothetical protein ACJJTC_016633 [Scirpophaga incertulas]